MTKKNPNYQFHTFESGLRLVSVPMKGTKTVAVYVLVGTGSKYETKENNGIAHFLEHMVFKGTTKRPGKMDIARELDSFGAEYNAFTTKEYTGYYAKASALKLDSLMDVVFDIYLNSKLDDADIQTEKGVIIEEINMCNDVPSRHVGDLFERLLYGDQPAGWDIAGTKEIIKKLERKDFMEYFNTHYIAENTVVAVAGNIKPDDVREKAERYSSTIRHGSSVIKPATKESQEKPALLLEYKKTDQTTLDLGFRAYHMYDKKKYALGLLGVILGGGASSRLWEEVREKRGLAYSIRAGQHCYTDSGYFCVSAGVNNKKALESIEVILAEIRKVKKEGITIQELQQAKDQIAGHMALSLEESDNIAESYAESVLFENRVLTPEEELDKIKLVTRDEVIEVAREVFDGKNLNLALIGPFKDEEPFRRLLKI
ncbi:MAG: pitrilysin family protein [Patescibacteria group bacterium]